MEVNTEKLWVLQGIQNCNLNVALALMAIFSIYLHMQIKRKTHTVNKVIKSKMGGLQKT